MLHSAAVVQMSPPAEGQEVRYVRQRVFGSAVADTLIPVPAEGSALSITAGW